MYSCNMKDRQKKGQRKRRIKLDEGGVICGIADSFTKPSSLWYLEILG